MEIKTIKKFHRTLKPAPDKSITHRALMFNALAGGESRIQNALLGLDCVSTIECVKKLGAAVSVEGDTVRVRGAAAFKDAALDVGNSGTTMRLFAGILSGAAGKYVLDGDASIRRRPMKRVILPLAEMGADIRAEDGRAPLTVWGKKLTGIRYEMPVASAQVKSAILLAGLCAEGTTTVYEPTPTRDHTEIMLKGMGADIAVSADGRTIDIRAGRLKNIDVEVPGDISSAAFPLILAAIVKGAELNLKGVGVNPTRTGILDVLKGCGAQMELYNVRRGVEKTADIRIAYAPLKPFSIAGDLVPRLIDEIPALAVLACFIEGTSTIAGAAELKVKESNRIEALVRVLSAMGADISDTDDGMIIRGTGSLRGGVVIDPLGDHRIAMAAAIAGAGAKRGVTVLNASAAEVSYPGFYQSVLGDACSGD
ncbi:MAG: 3-phosphoshikimate 1-carboxyvinyltransferase [Clostridiales bacterium]|jgi:3-phosphoshikimate 1-carboxyvinyltransferase|nr:3-phosphoshikimate 1-carboxyvinyltransferase [Clostridiales bacterium]